MTKEEITKHFKMIKHPEGGAFKETYRSTVNILADGFKGERSSSTVGCTVSPGVDFQDFMMPTRNELLMKYPKFKDIFMELTN